MIRKLAHILKPFSTSIPSHKLSYGQGGSCQLHLLKNSYNIQFETIWQDHCLIEVSEWPAGQSLSISEQGSKTIIHDKNVTATGHNIGIKFKIPEDYTFYGRVEGNIGHVKSQVSNKLRCNQMKVELMGKNRVFQWGSMECPYPKIQVGSGAIDINGLTFQNGDFKCGSFASRKVLFSGKFNLEASHLASIRSVVTYGTAVARIAAKFVEIESISGSFDIESEKVKIDRLWASPQGIKIKTQKIQKLSIETGTGTIECSEPIPQSAIKLGRLHKGKIIKAGENKIIIE